MENQIKYPELLTSDEDLLSIELENFKRGLQVVESCKHEGQLQGAHNFIKLIGAQHPGAASALKYMYLLKVQSIPKVDKVEDEI